MKNVFRVALTTGDIDGIGPEVTTKALCRIRPQKNIQFFLWRSHKFSKSHLRQIDRYFYRTTVKSWAEALKQPLDYHKTIIDIDSSLPPARWVETMAKAGMAKGIDALVTAPLSKTGIQQAGMKDRGHTNILRRVAKTPNIYMTFLGKKFNVVLLTGHVSLKKAYDQIDQERLKECLVTVHQARGLLSKKIQNKPMALVGLNPHAGEDGVIDNRENEIFTPVIKQLKKRKIAIEGPLVPDVCFQERFWSQYSFYVSSYHDQGLIPFKMVHSAISGVQISLGLPFVRTSVDHGTAKDIFGKNKAKEDSMKNAINVAISLLNQKPIKW